MNSSERKKTIWLVVIFSLLVNGLAWLGPLLGGSPASPGIGFFIWGTAPLVVSLLLRAVTRDWSDLGAKPTVRKNLVWYIISFLAMPVIMLLTLFIAVLISAASVSDFSLGPFLQTVLVTFPFFFIFAIFEEVGWRGYLSPKLYGLGINSYVTAVLVGIVWASWHLPYIRELTWVYSAEDLVTFLPRFYLVSIALALSYNEIRQITATFWPAVLMHATGNSFGHPLLAAYVIVAVGNEYLGSISNGFVFIVLVFLLGVAINRRRVKQAAPSESLA